MSISGPCSPSEGVLLPGSYEGALNCGPNKEKANLQNEIFFLELMRQLRSQEMKGGDVQPLVSPCEEGQDPGDGSPLAERRERGVSGKGRKRQHVTKFFQAAYWAAGPWRVTGSPGHRGAAHPRARSHGPSLGVARNSGDRPEAREMLPFL